MLKSCFSDREESVDFINILQIIPHLTGDGIELSKKYQIELKT